jgi:hypothetical protein
MAIEEGFYDARTVTCGVDFYQPNDGPKQWKFAIELVIDGQEILFRGDLSREFFERTEKSAKAAGVDTSSDDPREWTLKPGRAVRVAVKVGGKGNPFVSWIGPAGGGKRREIKPDEGAELCDLIAQNRGRDQIPF